MKEYQLLEERLISGTGLIRIPQANNLRDMILYMDVVRKPFNEFLNLQHTPNRGFYANIAGLFNGYVQQNFAMNYEAQMLRIVPDTHKQTIVALKCIDDNIVNMLLLLGDDITGVDYSFFPQLTEFTSRPLAYDELVFECYSDTAIQLQIWGLEIDICNPEREDNPPKPPKPPKPEQLPPRSPIADISPPYDDQDTFTMPFDYDDIPPQPIEDPDLPFGDECIKYQLDFTFQSATAGQTESSVQVFGEIDDINFEPSVVPGEEGFATLRVFARGPANVGLECESQIIESYTFFTVADSYTFIVTEVL